MIQIIGRFECANSTAELPTSYTEIYGISGKMKLKEGKKMKDQIIDLIDMCNTAGVIFKKVPQLCF